MLIVFNLIGAHKMERRHFNRVPFCTEATLFTAGIQWQTEIIDLSFKGALLNVPAGAQLKPGDEMTLSFTLQDSSTSIVMQGHISHIDKEQIGFHCTLLDIDSATTLRSLIALNLSDEHLLQRDLAALLRG